MEQISILKKLNSIFKQGYIPSRGYETYDYIPTKFYSPVSQLGNCFTHACFNLKNKHYEQYNITKEEFESLRNLDTYGGSQTAEIIIYKDFISLQILTQKDYPLKGILKRFFNINKYETLQTIIFKKIKRNIQVGIHSFKKQ